VSVRDVTGKTFKERAAQTLQRRNLLMVITIVCRAKDECEMFLSASLFNSA